jgi:hypothetical protein
MDQCALWRYLFLIQFETVNFATQALFHLYGNYLSNSTKGGIRLSYSKNPLGVRPNPPLETADGINSITEPLDVRSTKVSMIYIGHCIISVQSSSISTNKINQ